jgi:hypothetical protein
VSQQITTGLHSHLTGDKSAGSLYAALGGRIYDTFAPQDTQLPLMVVQKVTNPVTRSVRDVDKQDGTYQVDIYTDKDLGSSIGEIEQKLYDRLNGETFEVAGHDRAVATCINRDRRNIDGDDAIRSMSEYRIQASSSTS